jgi:hypothetical protein
MARLRKLSLSRAAAACSPVSRYSGSPSRNNARARQRGAESSYLSALKANSVCDDRVDDPDCGESRYHEYPIGNLGTRY